MKGPTSVPDEVIVSPNSLENEFLRLEIDSDGLVTSLYDKPSRRQLVDREAPLGFAQLVQATSTRFGPTKGEPLPLARPSIRVGLSGPLMGSLVISDSESPLSRTEITICAGEPVVRFRHTFDLRRTPYASYDDGNIIYDIAYPFDIPGGELLFDTPAGLLNPKTDYMPKAFHIINLQHGGDITGPGCGVSFASRQAFEWEFERVNWLWGTPTPPESTALMMRLLSKRDETEYKDGVGAVRVEPGSPHLLTFESAFFLHSGGSDFDRQKAIRFLESEANAMLAVPVAANRNGRLRAGSGQMIDVAGEGFVLLTFKRAEDGDGYVLRLMETAGRAHTVRIRSALLNIKGAELCDNVERPVRRLSVRRGVVEVPAGPRETVGVRIGFAPEN